MLIISRNQSSIGPSEVLKANFSQGNWWGGEGTSSAAHKMMRRFLYTAIPTPPHERYLHSPEPLE